MPTINLDDLFSSAKSTRQRLEEQGYTLNPATGKWRSQAETLKEDLSIQNTLEDLDPVARAERIASDTAARITAETAAKKQQPLGRTDLIPYRAPAGTTQAEIEDLGLVPLTNEQLKATDKLAEAKNIIAILKAASGKVNTGRIQGLSQINEALAGKLGLPGVGQSAAALSDQERRSYLGQLSRALGGEVGVLTDRDIERIDGVLPNVYDNKFKATRKVNTLNALTALADLNVLRRQRGLRTVSLDEYGISEKGYATSDTVKQIKSDIKKSEIKFKRTAPDTLGRDQQTTQGNSDINSYLQSLGY